MRGLRPHSMRRDATRWDAWLECWLQHDARLGARDTRLLLAALLTVGTPDDVRSYCKDLIDAVGMDGGFIMGPSGQTEDVKIENVKAMVDFTKEYGV